MKRIIRFSVWVVFIALVALTVTSYKVTAQNGTGACANCGDPKGTVTKCNGSEAVTEGTASGNCVSAEGTVEQVDTDNDGAPDTNVNCVVTKFYVCEAQADQGCGLMQACGGQ